MNPVKTKTPFNLYIYLFLFFLIPQVAYSDNSLNQKNETLIQEGDLTVTYKDALLMLQDMTWDQKKRLLGNKENLKSLLLSYLILKKQERAAINQSLDESSLVIWKLKKLKAQLLSKELVKHFRSNITIPNSVYELAKETYNAHPEKYIIQEKVSVSHILLNLNKESTEKKEKQTLKKLQNILKEINTGLNFEDAVKKYSEDDATAENGGVINYFKKGQMAPPFEKAAFDLKTIGDISKPVKTRFGYHLIKLIGRIDSNIISFKDAKHLLIKNEKEKFLQVKTDEFLKSFKINKSTNIYLAPIDKLIQKEGGELANPLF